MNSNSSKEETLLYIPCNKSITLLKIQHKEIKSSQNFLVFLIFVSICYFFSTTSLLIANTQSLESIDSYMLPFHNLDFIGSFVFALIESLTLIYAEVIVFGEPRFFLVLINVGLTLVAAILFLIKSDYWEVTSHWIEFSAQVFLTSIDLIFIYHQFKDTNNPLYKYRYYEVALVFALLLSSIFKLLFYGNIIKTGIDGEKLAHYLEFIGEQINVCFALIFLFVLYSQNEKKLLSIIKDLGDISDKKDM